MCPRLDSQHKHRVRRGGRRRGDTKARHEFCTDRFAGQERTDTISTSAAERIPKPWFWRRSFLPFFRRRKKGSRRRHDAGDYGLPRAQSVLAMTYHTRYTISPNRAQVLLSVIFMSRYWPRADLSPTRCTRRPPAVRADRGQRASSVSPSTRHRRVLPT